MEAPDRGRVLGQPRAHHLDRHLPLHADVFGQVHLAHATFAELPVDQVTVGEDAALQRVRRVFGNESGAIERAEAVVTFVPRPTLRTELRAHRVTAGRLYDCDATRLACITGRS
jgi:hypothetical protein